MPEVPANSTAFLPQYSRHQMQISLPGKKVNCLSFLTQESPLSLEDTSGSEYIHTKYSKFKGFKQEIGKTSFFTI